MYIHNIIDAVANFCNNYDHTIDGNVWFNFHTSLVRWDWPSKIVGGFCSSVVWFICHYISWSSSAAASGQQLPQSAVRGSSNSSNSSSSGRGSSRGSSNNSSNNNNSISNYRRQLSDSDSGSAHAREKERREDYERSWRSDWEAVRGPKGIDWVLRWN